MINPDLDTIHIEAATYRRLVRHLMHERSDVRDSDLMAAAGFCRDCLSQWYREAAEARGVTMTAQKAREPVHGMPVAQWKALYQPGRSTAQSAASLPPADGAC